MRRLNGGEEIETGVRFYNVTVGPAPQRVSCQRNGSVLADENYARLRTCRPNPGSSFNAAHAWKADVQKNDIRVKFADLPDCFFTVDRFPYYFEIRIGFKNRADTAPRYFVVIDEYDPDWSHLRLSLLGRMLNKSYSYIRLLVVFHTVVTRGSSQPLGETQPSIGLDSYPARP